MYFYIYDSFLNTNKYRKMLERIEVRLSNFGIQGKIRRLNILHHQKEAIEESVRRGAKTIVFVGNDRSVAQAVDVLAKYDVVIGLLPIGGEQENHIARSLGIPLGDLACEALSRRTIARLDLGQVATHYFLTTAEVVATTFTCVGPRKTFRLKPLVKKSSLTIMNLPLIPLDATRQLYGNPRDGVLELIIHDATTSFTDFLRPTKRKKKEEASIFPIQELSLEEPVGATMTLDGCRSVKLPATIAVAPQKLRVIVGRERLFP